MEKAGSCGKYVRMVILQSSPHGCGLVRPGLGMRFAHLSVLKGAELHVGAVCSAFVLWGVASCSFCAMGVVAGSPTQRLWAGSSNHPWIQLGRNGLFLTICADMPSLRPSLELCTPVVHVLWTTGFLFFTHIFVVVGNSVFENNRGEIPPFVISILFLLVLLSVSQYNHIYLYLLSQV